MTELFLGFQLGMEGSSLAFLVAGLCFVQAMTLAAIVMYFVWSHTSKQAAHPPVEAANRDAVPHRAAHADQNNEPAQPEQAVPVVAPPQPPPVARYRVPKPQNGDGRTYHFSWKGKAFHCSGDCAALKNRRRKHQVTFVVGHENVPNNLHPCRLCCFQSLA